MKYIISIIGILCVITFSGCTRVHTFRDGPPLHDIDVSQIPEPIPHPLSRSRFGNNPTYYVWGRSYHVLGSASGYRQRGVASWYGRKFHGQRTSSGEPYDMFALTAASRTLPIPTFARVTNLQNGKSTIVKVNDRGPFAENRIMDLSYAAAKKLGFANRGTAIVEVKAITFERPHPFRMQRTLFANGERHYLQVATFRSQYNAQALRTRLRRYTRQPILIKAIAFRNRRMYRVQIGPLVGVKESDKLQHLLKHLGLGEAVKLI